jgi:two-component system chemotaxis sensor kinase CheA
VNDDRTRADAAEKTVAVLKKKVLELYDGGTRSALAAQLERARKREEDNRRRREELSRYNQRLEREVKERTRAIKTILDHVGFGFLIVGRDLVVQPECTLSCRALLGRDDVEGRPLPDLLGFDARMRAQFVLGVDQVFEDMLPEQASLAQLPHKVVRSDGRVLSIDGSVVRAPDESVAGVLFSIADITALEAATRESRTNRTLVQLLKERESFRAFLVDVRRQLVDARAALVRGDLGVVRRIVHTIKGNAASFALDDVVAVVHALEERERFDPAGLDEITASLRGFLERHKGVLDLELDETGSAFEVTSEQLSGLRAILARGASASDVRQWIERVGHKPARQVLGPVEEFTQRLAERLGKRVHFALDGGDVAVDVERVRPVFQTLTHLLRNAIDHGVERPSERGNKPRDAAVALSIEDRPRDLRVVVHDDGRGIDVDTLGRRAAEKGFVTEQDVRAMSEDQRVSLIFIDGLSSAEVTTTISGRGIGMSAVRDALTRVGGRIDVHSAKGNGTTFTLTIPKNAEVA